jgi:hypothetical protein
MKSIKVRFNLGAGKNYMKWKIEYPDGKVEYFRPTNIQLVMSDCTLKNYKKTADKIFKGANKTVCAWVLCKEIEIRKENFEPDNENKIRYNPRVQPNWMFNGEIVDGKKFDNIISVDFGLYIKQSQLIEA